MFPSECFLGMTAVKYEELVTTSQAKVAKNVIEEGGWVTIPIGAGLSAISNSLAIALIWSS